jgi:hypothetical protein
LFRNPEINNAIFKTVLTECSETMRNLQWLDLRETGVTMHDAAVRPAPGQPEGEDDCGVCGEGGAALERQGFGLARMTVVVICTACSTHCCVSSAVFKMTGHTVCVRWWHNA